MQSLCFATNNNNKLKEIKQLVGNKLQLLSLADIGCNADLPETSDTIEGNAFQKADYVHKNFQIPCFADDTGLFVETLNGEPGVYSARYANRKGSQLSNLDFLLSELGNVKERAAYFKTVIAFVSDNKRTFFEEKCEGDITTTAVGAGGFGYDPVFRPKQSDLTFAEMSAADKNLISHRGKATREFIKFLQSHFDSID